ncbi:MAG: TIGR00159 family protein [Clostridiales bacterium]|nr:MAG: TIGR00159 family protein [Clostridiales bacterium]
MNQFFTEVITFFQSTFSNPILLVFDLLDIALIAVLIYFVIRFIRDTRAAQLLKGIILLVVLLQVTRWFNLTASAYILSQVLEFGVLAMLIVFQPELRSVLERVGRKGLNSISKLGADNETDEKLNAINELCDACANLSATKTGALIVIEKDTKLGDIAKTGIEIDASISKELVMNIFYPKAPLHDGAVIVRNFRVIAAGCFLPLSTRSVASELGTRHRAAIGVSEVSDTLVIVVSEETGIISIATGGTLTRRITPEALKKQLENAFILQKGEKKKEFLSNRWKEKKKK